jgi:hypothetical protein
MNMVHVAGKNRDSDIKVFCFFSSEKKAFFSLTGSLSRSWCLADHT